MALAAAMTLMLSAFGGGAAFATEGVVDPAENTPVVGGETTTGEGPTGKGTTGEDTTGEGPTGKSAESAPKAGEAESEPEPRTSYKIGGTTFAIETKEKGDYVVSKHGNFTNKCEVDWRVSAANDPTLDDYPNNGFGYKILPASKSKEFSDPGWSEMQHWGRNGLNSWRLPVFTDSTIQGAKLHVALPDGPEYTFNRNPSRDSGLAPAGYFNTKYVLLPGYAGKFRPLNDTMTAANQTPRYLGDTRRATIDGKSYRVFEFDLGDMLGKSGYALMIEGKDAAGAVAVDPKFGFAKITGTYLAGSQDCPGEMPPLPDPKPIEKCEMQLTGRTVRPLGEADITVRDKWGGEGTNSETNADGWGFGDTRYFRLYARSDKAVSNVTYTARAAQGFTFTGVEGIDKMLTPSKFLNKDGKPNVAIEVDAGATPVISDDGKTITFTIKHMPANSSFSFNAVAKVDGTGQPMVIDHLLTGALDHCVVNPPSSGGGGWVPAPEPKPQPEAPKPAPKPEAPKPSPAPVKPTAPAKPVTPTAPAKPVAPSKPAVRMVTRTFQVDRYMPRTAKQARLVASLDNDGLLKYREDRPMWGANRWQFVTVRVPANATHQQVMKAINAKTSRAIGDVNTSRRIARAHAGRPYIVAWELGKGATTKAPWGPKNNVSQIFFARG